MATDPQVDLGHGASERPWFGFSFSPTPESLMWTCMTTLPLRLDVKLVVCGNGLGARGGVRSCVILLNGAIAPRINKYQPTNKCRRS